MGRLQKKIEDIMSAVSFAEEGEFEAARELVKEQRRILLAVRTGQVDRKTFRYAINTCKRIGAKLDILYISPAGSEDHRLDQCLSDLKESGIDYRLIKKSGCMKQEIIDYTSAKKDIVFAVTESSDNLEVDCKGKGKGLSEAWQNLKCPLVVVAENT